MNFAIEILKECYIRDERKARRLLIRFLPQWGKTTCILIAVKANNRQFISQTACQDLFNSIWMGHMTQENGTLRLLLCIAIPVLVPLLAKFKKNEDDELAPDQTTRSRVKMKQESKPPLPRGKTITNLEQSHQILHEKETKDSPGDEAKVHVKSFSGVEKITSFYQAPVVIFFYNVISYMMFLGLFSYILLSKLGPKLCIEEIVLIVWVFTIFTEEIRQVCTMISMTMKTKLLSYISDGWNIVDVITISLFIIGMTLRNIENPQTLEAARVVLGVNLVAFFLRLLQIFSVHRELGPKLLMINRMVHNMTYFVVILLVFVVAYAIASHAILYPNTELSLDTLIAIFRQPFWTIHGELMLDEIEGVQECAPDVELYGNGTLPRCPTMSGKYFALMMKGVYVMMCNILLMNLLIAMFSYTIQMVQENSDMHWYFQRYSLIHEYYNRPFMAPPLILIVHVFQLIRVIVRKCLRCCTKKSPPPKRNAFLKYFTNTNELRDWEGVIAEMVHHKKEQADQESIDNRVKTVASQLDQLVIQIDELQVQQQAVTVEDTWSSPSHSCSMSEPKSETGVEPGSTNLGKRIENIEKQLQWIVESLKEHQLGASWAIPNMTDGSVEGHRK